MIIKWDRESSTNRIVSIHGDLDKTIPIKNIKQDYVVVNGSHMITLTRAEEVSIIIDEIVLEWNV